MALVSLLLAGGAGLLVLATRTIRTARVQTTATLLASQKIEEVVASAEFAGLAHRAGTHEDLLGLDGRPVSGDAQPWFRRRWTLAPGWAATSLTSIHVAIFVPGGSAPVAELEAVVPSRRASDSTVE